MPGQVEFECISSGQGHEWPYEMKMRQVQVRPWIWPNDSGGQENVSIDNLERDQDQ